MPIRIVADRLGKRQGQRGRFGGPGKGKKAGPSAGFDPKRKIPKSFHEIIGGSERGKPHSTKKGRIVAGRRRIKRILGKDRKLVPDPRYYPDRPKKPIDPREPFKKEDRIMTPLRAQKAVGGVAKAGKRFLDFIKTGKHVDKHGVKTNVPKAAERLTGKPHVDHGKRKKIKHLGKGKAAGGRIGLSHGGSAGAAIRGRGAEIK